MRFFFNNIGEMVCLAGDTLPEITVTVEDAGSLTGTAMYLILSEWSDPDVAVLRKACSLLSDGTGFSVVLDSSDTRGLSGVFRMQFRLIDTNDKCHNKLYGVLTVRPCPQEVTS